MHERDTRAAPKKTINGAALNSAMPPIPNGYVCVSCNMLDLLRVFSAVENQGNMIFF